MPTRDEKFLKAMRNLQCIACGAPPPSEAHHIQPKGMGNSLGGDDWFNVIPLCADDHTQAEWAWHRNRRMFFRRYPHVWSHLKTLGWDFLRLNYKIKLIHPEYLQKIINNRSIGGSK